MIDKIINSEVKELSSGTKYFKYELSSKSAKFDTSNIIDTINNINKINFNNNMTYIQVAIFLKTSDDEELMRWTKAVKIDEIEEVINEMITEEEIKYDIEGINASKYNITFIDFSNSKNSMFGQGGEQKSFKCDGWFCQALDTKTNCLYVASYISEHKMIIDTDDKIQIKNILQASRRIKCNINSKNKNFSLDEDIQQLANRKKTKFIIHKKENDNIVETKIFDGGIQKSNKIKQPINLLLLDSHYYGMFKMDKDLEKKELKQYLLKPNKKINNIEENLIKNKSSIKNTDEDPIIATWDLETIPIIIEKEELIWNKKKQITETKIIKKKYQKPYACGFYDGKNLEMFWGDNCIKDFELFLKDYYKENQTVYLYAHNGGKFDDMFLFEQLISNSNYYNLNSDNCIELNGRWLNIVLERIDNHKNKLIFRDSISILTGSLEKICKDFKVKHQKLTETVSHEMIEQNGWEIYIDDLQSYLEHDVKGLYEVLEKFNEIIKTETFKKFKSNNILIQDLFNNKGVNMKKNKLIEGLKFDGYDVNLNCAYDYHEKEHYKGNFNEIKKSDELKKDVCEKNKIKYIIFDYKMPEEIIKNKINVFCDNLNKEQSFDQLKKLINQNKTKPEKECGYCESWLDISDCMTSASLAKKFFMMKYYNHKITPIYKLEDNIDKYIRDFYYGGRVECFHLGEVKKYKKFYYFDFTSLYPSQMLNKLPYGYPELKSKEEIDINNFFGFIRCKVTTINRDIKPLHGILEDGKLKFGYLQEKEMVLFSEELKLGLKHNIYKYDILDGYAFKSAYIMKKMSNEVFQKKKEAKQNNQKALAQIWKIIINSSYGFWGLRTKDRDGVKIYPRGEAPIKEYIQKRQFKGESDFGKYTILRVDHDLEIKDFNVSIASAISSYSRCRLWSLINDVEQKGKKVFMCDTDSIITNCNIMAYKDLKEKYMWDGTGDELGSLKNELHDLVKTDGKEQLYFDKLILNGCKFYSLKSTKYSWIEKGKEVNEICKCKGYSQKNEPLTYEMYKQKNNKIISQKRTQFNCGLNKMCTNDDDAFKIEITEVTKKCRRNYNKGNVQKYGEITPHEIK